MEERKGNYAGDVEEYDGDVESAAEKVKRKEGRKEGRWEGGI
jgi:hypothetical protein